MSISSSLTSTSVDLAVEQKGNFLNGQSIAFCLGGGVGAVEAPKIVRELRRYGASVRIYATKQALRFVGELALEWASTAAVVQEWSGLAPHIVSEEIVVVLPATANLMGKTIFLLEEKAGRGIADDVVSTLLASALGHNALAKEAVGKNKAQKLIIFLPAMHETLAANPFVMHNRRRLQQAGVFFLTPTRAEGKLKVPACETLCQEIIRLVHLATFPERAQQQILLTAGPVGVALDGARELSNFSTGTTGLLLMQQLYLLGFSLTLLVSEKLLSLLRQVAPDFLSSSQLRLLPFRYYQDYEQQTFATVKNQPLAAALFAAAVTDFLPTTGVSPLKISSKAPPHLQLMPTKKIVYQVRKRFPALKMVVFKLSAGVSREALWASARLKLKEGYQAVVANRLEETASFLSGQGGKKYYFSPAAKVPKTLSTIAELAEAVVKTIT